MGDGTLATLGGLVVLIVAINRLSAYLWREERASLVQINERLVEENHRLREDKAEAERRRDFYRKLAHDQSNQIMELTDELSTVLRDHSLIRRPSAPPTTPYLDEDPPYLDREA